MYILVFSFWILQNWISAHEHQYSQCSCLSFISGFLFSFIWCFLFYSSASVMFLVSIIIIYSKRITFALLAWLNVFVCAYTEPFYIQPTTRGSCVTSLLVSISISWLFPAMLYIIWNVSPVFSHKIVLRFSACIGKWGSKQWRGLCCRRQCRISSMTTVIFLIGKSKLFFCCVNYSCFYYFTICSCIKVYCCHRISPIFF